MANPRVKVWNSSNFEWSNVGVVSTFSTIKIDNGIFFDADTGEDTIEILGGDNIQILPDDTFSSIVITTSGIGNVNDLTTNNKEIVASINEINSKVDSGNKVYKLSNLTKTGDYCGDTSVETIAEWCDKFDLLYLTPDGYKKASALSEGDFKYPCVAMALQNGIGGNLNILLRGYIRNNTWSFTKGQMVYMSTSNASIITTQPNQPGQIVQIIGYAVDTNIIHFNPNYMWITI